MSLLAFTAIPILIHWSVTNRLEKSIKYKCIHKLALSVCGFGLTMIGILIFNKGANVLGLAWMLDYSGGMQTLPFILVGTLIGFYGVAMFVCGVFFPASYAVGWLKRLYYPENPVLW
jgi:hypothetical protein